MSIVLLIHLIGIPVSYLICRRDFKKSVGIWTVGDRCLTLFVVIVTSWISAFAFVLATFITDKNKPASW